MKGVVANRTMREIRTTADLLAAATDAEVRQISVAADLADVPTLRLLPGQSLTSAGERATLRFAADQDGLQLSADNQVEDLQLVAHPDRQALFNASNVEGLGRLVLRHLFVSVRCGYWRGTGYAADT